MRDFLLSIKSSDQVKSGSLYIPCSHNLWLSNMKGINHQKNQKIIKLEEGGLSGSIQNYNKINEKNVDKI